MNLDGSQPAPDHARRPERVPPAFLARREAARVLEVLHRPATATRIPRPTSRSTTSRENAETRLTFTGQSFAAAWSPDGTRIAFGTYHGDRALDHGRRRLEPAPRRRAERRATTTSAGTTSPGRATTGSSSPSGRPWTAASTFEWTRSVPTARIGRRSATAARTARRPDASRAATRIPGSAPTERRSTRSRGFPYAPPGFPAQVVRKLYAFSSDAWAPGKVETGPEPPVRAGLHRGRPQGLARRHAHPALPRLRRRAAHGRDAHRRGRLATGRWIADGFGADWNPAYGAATDRGTSATRTEAASSGRWPRGLRPGRPTDSRTPRPCARRSDLERVARLRERDERVSVRTGAGRLRGCRRRSPSPGRSATSPRWSAGRPRRSARGRFRCRTGGRCRSPGSSGNAEASGSSDPRATAPATWRRRGSRSR